MKSNSPLAPLSNPTFSKMWLASLISNVGTWMHSIGAVWLMTSLSDSTLMVALVQTASTLPIFFFALPAGVLADASNKRNLLLSTNVLMLFLAGLFALLVLGGNVNPVVVLLFTFFLGLGAAFTAPAWQASIPEIVSKVDLQQALVLGSININVSRSIGPALAGLLITSVGIASPFFLNAVSFLLIISVLLRWKYQTKESNSKLPKERIVFGLKAGIRYALNSKPLKDTILHIAGFIFFANAFWVLLPIISQDVLKSDADFFGFLMTAVGIGALIGAFLLPKLKSKLQANQIVLFGTILTASVTLVFAFIQIQLFALIVSLFFGLGWILVLSSINLSAQVALPNWVRARGLAVFMMVFFGSMSLASTFWGWFSEQFSIFLAMVSASIGAIMFVVITYRFKLQQGAELNLNPAMHWAMPVTHERVVPEEGPVMITVQYQILEQDREAFLEAIYLLGASRKRDGADQWGVYEDIEIPGSFIEHFLEDSWNTHLHHHQRVTESDKLLEDKVKNFHQGKNKPQVKHYLASHQ